MVRVPASFDERHVRNPYAVPIFAFWVAACIVLVSTIAPDSRADAITSGAGGPEKATQQFTAAGEWDHTISRDSYGAAEKPKPAAAPFAGAPDPGTAKEIAWRLLQERGWGQSEYDCLVALWTKESHWNVYAENRSSGAYGIPQALPGSKMAAAGADWRTNPRTQIVWGLAYIQGRYATPCGAWDHSVRKNWY